MHTTAALMAAVRVLRPRTVVVSAPLLRSRDRTIAALTRMQDRGEQVFYGGAAFAAPTTRFGVPGACQGIDSARPPIKVVGDTASFAAVGRQD